jgi:short-subunit dehydrogenase
MNDPLVITADLSQHDQALEIIRTTIDHFGSLDVLVNNAASIIVSPSDRVTTEDLLKAYAINLLAPVIATQEAIGFMRASGGGHIINIGSPGFYMGIPYYSPYVCSKAAFSAWTRTIQAEWAGSVIKISEYFPGYIATDSKPDSRLGDIDQDFLMDNNGNFLSRVFTRPKTPDDVAKHLVQLVLRPKQLAYSGWTVRMGAFIANFPGFRLALAGKMARNARSKKNLPVFSR